MIKNHSTNIFKHQGNLIQRTIVVSARLGIWKVPVPAFQNLPYFCRWSLKFNSCHGRDLVKWCEIAAWPPSPLLRCLRERHYHWCIGCTVFCFFLGGWGVAQGGRESLKRAKVVLLLQLYHPHPHGLIIIICEDCCKSLVNFHVASVVTPAYHLVILGLCPQMKGCASKARAKGLRSKKPSLGWRQVLKEHPRDSLEIKNKLPHPKRKTNWFLVSTSH